MRSIQLMKTASVSRLSYVRDTPDVCKWLVPEYITAVGLYLVLCRLRFAKTYVPDTGKKPASKAVPPAAIKKILDDVNQLRTGLSNAVKEFVSLRSMWVNRPGLGGTPESIVIIKQISKEYLGDEYAAKDESYDKAFPNGSDWVGDFKVFVTRSPDPITMLKAGQGYKGATDPDPIPSALKHLDDMSTALQQDLATVTAGGWPENLLKIDWQPTA